MLVPSVWVKTVKEAKRKLPVFEVVYVQHPLTDNMEPDGTPIVKVKHFKKALDPILADSVVGISKLRGLVFSKESVCAKMSLLDSEYSIPIELLNRRSKDVDVQNVFSVVPSAHTSFLKVAQPKVNDVKYLLSFYDLPQNCTCYRFIEGEEGVPDYEENEYEF